MGRSPGRGGGSRGGRGGSGRGNGAAPTKSARGGGRGGGGGGGGGARGKDKNKRKRKGEPGRAPLHPDDLNGNSDDDDMDVGEEDLDFVSKHRAFLGSSFLTKTDFRHESRAEKKQKKAASARQEDAEAEYERRPRNAEDSDDDDNPGRAPGIPMEALPVKTEAGELKYIKPDKKLKGMPKDTDQEQDFKFAPPKEKKGARKSQPEPEPEPKPEPEDEIGDIKTAQESRRQEYYDSLKSVQAKEQRRAELKVLMAKAATALLESPEENYGKLKELLPLCADKDEVVAQLAMVSLLAVFKDICPGYRIRLPTEKELEVKVSKEVQRVRDYEAALLRAYQQFLRALLQASNAHVAGTNTPAARCKTSVKVMCGLLTALPYFNYRTDLLSALVPKAAHMDPGLHEPCCQALIDLCKDDRRREATLEATQMVAQIVKQEKCQVPAAVLRVFLHLKFDKNLRSILDNEDGDQKGKKEKRGKYKHKGKHLNKEEVDEQEALLQADLQESEARLDPKEQRKLQTQVLEAIFEVYFRVLKFGQEEAVPLLDPTFTGLAQFAHLISVDFLGDLMVALHSKLVRPGLPLELQAKGILAACDILSGQGSALNVDPNNLMTLLYGMFAGVLPHGELAVGGSNPGQLLVQAVQKLVCDRRSTDMPRLAAFVKRLGTCALHAGVGEAMGLMGCMRQLLARHLALRSLLDNEGAIPGVYKPTAEDPSAAGAQSTMLWEMALLPQHWHPAVAAHAQHMAAMPLEGPAPAMTIMKSHELFAAHDVAKGTFNPAVRLPSKQRTPKSAQWRHERLAAPNAPAFRELVGAATWDRQMAGAAGTSGSEAEAAEAENVNRMLVHMFREARAYKESVALRREATKLETQVGRFKEHLAAVEAEAAAEHKAAALAQKDAARLGRAGVREGVKATKTGKSAKAAKGLSAKR